MKLIGSFFALLVYIVVVFFIYNQYYYWSGQLFIYLHNHLLYWQMIATIGLFIFVGNYIAFGLIAASIISGLLNILNGTTFIYARYLTFYLVIGYSIYYGIHFYKNNPTKDIIVSFGIWLLTINVFRISWKILTAALRLKEAQINAN